MTAHSALPNSDLHEAKGASAATAGQALVAGGGGAATFQFQRETYTFELDDISTSSSTWVVPRWAGTIVGFSSVIHGGLGGSDVTLQLKIGGVNVTNGSLLVTVSGSVAGNVDSVTPSGNNTITANQAVECATDGISTATVRATLTIEVLRSA